MTKLLIGVTWILLLAVNSQAQSASNLKTDKLLGNVKAVRTEQTWTKKNIESKHVLMTVETYDIKGNKTEWNAYMGNSNPLRSLFTYNEEGNVIEEVWYDSADELKGKTVYQYNAKRKLIQQTSSNGVRTIFSYDSRNNKILQTVFDEAKDEGPRMFGPVEKTVRYSYDQDNNLTEIVSSNADGSRIWNPELQAHRITFTYDSKGRHTSRTVYNKDNSLRTKTRNDYDSFGRIVKESTLNGKDSITQIYRYTYQVDGNGNWVKQVKTKQVANNGKRRFIAIETIYRSIDYY